MFKTKMIDWLTLLVDGMDVFIPEQWYSCSNQETVHIKQQSLRSPSSVEEHVFRHPHTSLDEWKMTGQNILSTY